MTDRTARATSRYRIVVTEAKRPQRWCRVLGVLAANIAGWFDGFGTGGVTGTGSGPTNPGGQTVSIVDDTTGEHVFEFVEGFGDDAHVSLSRVRDDLETQTVAEFEATWIVTSE